MTPQTVIDVDLLKESLDPEQVISRYIPLKKQGPDYIGLCPFHAEKTPSFKVHVRRRMQLPDWKCFGCGAAGDIIKFIQLIEGVDFRGAVEILTTQFSGDPRSIQTSASIQRQRDAVAWYEKQVEGVKALAQCYERGLLYLSGFLKANPDNNILAETCFEMERDLNILLGSRRMHPDIHLQDKELREDDGILGDVLRFGMNGYAVAASYDVRHKARYIEPVQAMAGRLKSARLAVRIVTRLGEKALTESHLPTEVMSGICETFGDEPEVVQWAVDELRQARAGAARKVLGANGGRGNTRTAEGNRQRHPRRRESSRQHNEQPAT